MIAPCFPSLLNLLSPKIEKRLKFYRSLHPLHPKKVDFFHSTITIPTFHGSSGRQLRKIVQTDDVLPSLEDQGVRQLYPKGPNVDFKKDLRSLNRELQLHILELADVLVERPFQYARRFEDISLIFKNLHHVLNYLRPHQARTTLIHILELQIQRRKHAVEEIKNFPSLHYICNMFFLGGVEEERRHKDFCRSQLET